MKNRLPWKTWTPLFLAALTVAPLPIFRVVAAAGEPAGYSQADIALQSRNLASRNLARSTAGARLEVQTPGKTAPAEDASAASALLHDDDPLGYALPAGTTSLIVSLPKIEVLNRFNFLNLTAHGKVSVAVANSKLPSASSGWRAVQAIDFADDNGVVTCDLGCVEAKFVRVSFDAPAGGRIDTFGLYGQRTLGESLGGARGLAGTGAKGGDDVRYVLFNYAIDAPHSGVVLVSPGENLDQAQQMADGDVGTAYTFKATDPAPMAVVDLGETRVLTRVGTTFKAGAGHLDLYLVADPADNGKRGGARTIEDVVTTNFPGDRTPVLSVDTGKQPGLNRAGATVSGLSGRYLVMSFHPSGGLPSAAGNFKDFKDAADFKDVDGGHSVSDAPVGQEPLQVSEITGYGNVPPASGVTLQTPLLPGTPNLPGTVQPPPISPPGAGTITP